MNLRQPAELPSLGQPEPKQTAWTVLIEVQRLAFCFRAAGRDSGKSLSAICANCVHRCGLSLAYRFDSAPLVERIRALSWPDSCGAQPGRIRRTADGQKPCSGANSFCRAGRQHLSTLYLCVFDSVYFFADRMPPDEANVQIHTHTHTHCRT